MEEMSTYEAFKIVLELARQNIQHDNEYADEYARQIEACDIVQAISETACGDN